MFILIVEDEILIGLALKMLLCVAGYQVLGPAPSADEALLLAATNPPALAFVDINILGDRDGVAVAQALTERHGTSCIFLTAQVEQARTAKNVAVGVIRKPYDAPALLSAVKIVAAIRHGESLPPIPRYFDIFTGTTEI